jgi:methylmalonyl-CoA/ethylmalonyl-CoA epimerase
VRVSGLNHVGILTRDFDAVSRVLGDVVGLEVSGPEPEPELGIEVLWVTAGELRLEFIRPTDEDGVAAELLRSGQGGVHHVALTVSDLEEAMGECADAGVPTQEEHPQPGVAGSRIAFLQPEDLGGALVELVEESR